MPPREPHGLFPDRFLRTRGPTDTPPRIDAISPNSDRIAGGVSVVITGANFSGSPVVLFGTTPATSVVVVDAFTITATAPAHVVGLVNVSVTVNSRTATLFGAFTYYTGIVSSISPAFGTLAGGYEVTIFGFNFVTGSTITFGGIPATGVTFVDSQHYLAIVPAHAVGYVDIVITEPSTTTYELSNGFQYTLLIRGEDIRRMPGVNIRDALNNTPNSCSFTLDGASPAPSGGEKIEIVDHNDGDRLLFAGNIQQWDQTYEGQINQLVRNATAVDFTWLANKRRPFASYKDVSATLVVIDLVARFVPGFTATKVQTNLAKVSVEFDGTMDLSTCLSKIASDIGGGHWYWDYTQDLHFFHTGPSGTVIVPGQSGPGTAMVVAEGAAVGGIGGYAAGFYLFWSTFVYDNGMESGLSPLSNCVALQGTNKIEYSLIPVGGVIGTHSVTARRVYFKYIGPGTITEIAKAFQINDNVTVALSHSFLSLAAGVVDGVAIGIADTISIPALPPATTSSGPSAAPNAFETTSIPTTPQSPQFSSVAGVHAITYSKGRWAFKVSSLYADGSESSPTAASNTVAMDGVDAVRLIIPPDPLALARKIYGSFGTSSKTKVSLSVVVEQLNRARANGTLGSLVGYGDVAVFGGAPMPTNYAGLVAAFGQSDIDSLLNRTTQTDPDWSPDHTMMWYLVPDGSTVDVTIGPGTGSGQPKSSGNVRGSEAWWADTSVTEGNGYDELGSDGLWRKSGAGILADAIPVWPNPDGPSLETATPPDPLDDLNTTLIRDGQFGTTFDVSQIRNRIFVRGAGTSLMTAAIAGDTELNVADTDVFPPSGILITGVHRLEYDSLSAPSGNGTIQLRAPLTVNLDQGKPVNMFIQVDDLDSQRERGLVELDKDGHPTDGIHEFMVPDSTLVTPFQMYARAQAELEMFSRPVVAISYSTRDSKSRAGAIVHVDLTNPPCKGDFLIQDVTIDQFHDESDELLPRYNVTAGAVQTSSSVAASGGAGGAVAGAASSVNFELNDLLLKIDKPIPPSSGVSGLLPAAATAARTPVEGDSFIDAIDETFSITSYLQSSTTTVLVGGTVSSNNGTITAVVDEIGSWGRCTSTAGNPHIGWSNGNLGGLGANGIRMSHRPVMRAKIRTGSSVAGMRYWMGFWNFGIITQFNVDQLTIPGCGIGFVSGVHAKPRMALHDGATFTWGKEFPEWLPNTVYDIRVSCDTGIFTASINGVVITQAGNTPTPLQPVLMGSSQVPANLKFFDTLRFGFAYSRGG